MEVANILSKGVGVCDHGFYTSQNPGNCGGTCPHNVDIYLINGSNNSNGANAGLVRLLDEVVTTCPHCGHGIITSASNTVNVNGMGIVRLLDDITLDAGSGVVSSDTLQNVISG